MDLNPNDDQVRSSARTGGRSKRNLAPADLNASTRRSRPPSKRSAKRPKTAASNELPVACPLFVRDPVADYPCITTGFTRGADVTQHIRRSHTLEIYCADCYDAFKTEGDRDEHTRLRGCTQRDPPSNAVLPAMLKPLPRGGTLTSKWYEIWDALFPNEDRPSSPFMYGDCRDTLRVVRRMELNQLPTGSSISLAFNRRLARLEGLGQDDSHGTGGPVTSGVPSLAQEQPPAEEPLEQEPFGGPALLSQYSDGLGFDSSMTDFGLMMMDNVSVASYSFDEYPYEDNDPSMSGNCQLGDGAA